MYHYRDTRDLRTLYELAGGRPNIQNTDKHNALSDAIIQLLSDNRLRERLGSAGEVLVKEKYTVEKMCRKYEALFRAEQEAKI